MDKAVSSRLITVAADVLVNYGLPALTGFITNLNKKDTVTIADIDSLWGDLNSGTYFPDLDIDDKE